MAERLHENSELTDAAERWKVRSKSLEHEWRGRVQRWRSEQLRASQAGAAGQVKAGAADSEEGEEASEASQARVAYSGWGEWGEWGEGGEWGEWGVSRVRRRGSALPSEREASEASETSEDVRRRVRRAEYPAFPSFHQHEPSCEAEGRARTRAQPSLRKPLLCVSGPRRAADAPLRPCCADTMKHVAAYLLAQLGGNSSPDAKVRLHSVCAPS